MYIPDYAARARMILITVVQLTLWIFSRLYTIVLLGTGQDYKHSLLL